MRRTEPQPRFVVCVNNKDYPASLELRKLYEVVAGLQDDGLDSARTALVRQVELLRRWVASGASYQQHWALVPPVRAHALPGLLGGPDPLPRMIAKE